jgi:hypothetical protein
MAQTFTTHLQQLPPDAQVVFAGDLNVYTSTEPAYQELLDETHAIVMRDPINSPGNWHSSSFAQREIHTQSTRQSSIFGDGAGGGMDDRFDFILLSESMLDANSPIMYVPGSYDAPGNDGSCYDQSITACADADVPYEVLSAMYHMSDHLPVVLDLRFNPGLTGWGTEATQSPNWWVTERGLHVLSHSTGGVELHIHDVLGREVYRAVQSAIVGENVIPIPTRLNGMHVLRLSLPGHAVVSRLWNGTPVR